MPDENRPELPPELLDAGAAGVVAAFQSDNGGVRPASSAMQGELTVDLASADGEGSDDAGGAAASDKPTTPVGADAGSPPPGEAAPAAPPASTPTPPDTVLIGGEEIPRWRVEQYFAAANAIAQLPLEQRQAVDTYLATGTWPTPPTATAGVTTPPGAGAVDDDLDDLDPIERAHRAEIAELRGQLGKVEQLAQQAVSHDQRTEADRVNDIVIAASDAFASEHKLTADQRDELALYAGQHGIGERLLPTVGGDYAAATTQALEEAMWLHPKYRQQMIAAQTEQAVSQALTDHEARQRRKDKASAVGGASGSVPGARATISEPGRPANRQDQVQGMADMIRQERASNGASG